MQLVILSGGICWADSKPGTGKPSLQRFQESWEVIMKLLLMHSLSNCDWEWKQRRRMENQSKGCGKRRRDVACIYQLEFLCKLWYCCLQDSVCQGMVVFNFYLFLCAVCISHMLVMIWWQSGLTVSTLLFFSANQVNIYCTLIWELKPYFKYQSALCRKH